MKKFAIIEHGIVTNIAISETALDTNWVDITNNTQVIGPGCLYSTGVFTQAVREIPTKRILTKLEYMSRFTDEELVGIYTAAKTVVLIEIWLEKLKVTTEINLDDPRTIAGLQTMETSQLIAVGRAADILA